MASELSLFNCFLTNGTPKGFFSLHFNQAIPRIEGVWTTGIFGESFGPISYIPKKRAAIAKRLAVMNQGRISTELLQLGKVFSSFIEDLNRINGLISVDNRNPYRVDYRVGFLFDATEIGERIASSLHTHFFWEQEYTFTVSVKFKLPAAVADPEKTVRVKAKNRVIDPQ